MGDAGGGKARGGNDAKIALMHKIVNIINIKIKYITKRKQFTNPIFPAPATSQRIIAFLRTI